MAIEMLEVAKEYLKHHYSVIPANTKDKKFYVEWTEYQKKLPTIEEITKWWTDFPDAGIGIITGIVSGLAVVDLDIHKNPNAKADIEPYIPDSLVFPIADSPSGGEHWYFRCVDADITSHAPIPGFKNIDIRANGGVIIAPPSGRSNGRQYTWHNNLNILTTEIPPIPKALYDLLPRKGKKEVITSTSNMFIDGSRDEDLFHVAWTLMRAKMPHTEIYQTLIRLAQACTPPFPIKEAEIKVLSAIKRASEQPRDILKEVQQWSVTQDKFRIESCFNELALISKEQKLECRNAVTDLVKRGVIEKDKGIGVFRLVNNNIEHIEIKDTLPEPLSFRWPFMLENKVDIYRGNVAVIAGTSNAGKTAFLLNCVLMNKDNFKIRYLSSEMDTDELSMRLKGFGIGLESFRNKVEWIKRSKDWWDLILPNDINIIDFMEIHEKFYEIGDWIKKVFDRLREGIALIAIQKRDANTLIGVGGAGTKEKARLYLAIDYGVLAIVKAKNWHDFSKDPNGEKIHFSLKKGVIMEATSGWGLV